MSAKDRIIQSAKKLISQKGYHHTTVEDIVRHAGLSKGAFYFYFRSKDQLMEELVNSMAERTKQIMREWLSKDLPAVELIKGHIREFLIECYEERHIAYAFFFELMCSKENFRKLYRKHLQEIRELLTQMVRRGYERGEFVCGSVKTVVGLIAGYVRLVYMERLLLEDASLEEVLREAEEGLELILRGLRCG